MSLFPEHKNIDTLVTAVLDNWPQHKSLAEKSFANRAPDVMAVSDTIAGLVLQLAPHHEGGLQRLCEDYRFLCEQIVLPEELYFRRNGAYRLKTFEEADREVYSNAEYMGRYMNGLLMSDTLWSNHAHTATELVNGFLSSLPDGAAHLEIGPGHGLLLYFAARQPQIAELHAWDVSRTSIEKTRRALDHLGVTRPVDLALRNLFDPPGPEFASKFDSIVLSEILEHITDPVAALKAVKPLLKPTGKLWVNVPANSPAPDHLFLFESLEHAERIVRDAGFDIERSVAFAMTGTTLEKAVRNKTAISCVVTGAPA